MAIASVRAKVNGTWYTLAYDSASGTYRATITAPGATSFRQAGGYYDVEIEATNTAGTTFTTNGGSLSGLRLVVRETIVPVITIVSPSAGAYVVNNRPPIVCDVVDEANGSGINLRLITVQGVDGAAAITAIKDSCLIRLSLVIRFSTTTVRKIKLRIPGWYIRWIANMCIP